MPTSDANPNEDLNRRVDRLRKSLSWRPSLAEALSSSIHQKPANDDAKLRSAIRLGRFVSAGLVGFVFFSALNQILSPSATNPFNLLTPGAMIVGIVSTSAFTAIGLLWRRVVALEEELRELRRSISVTDASPSSKKES